MCLQFSVDNYLLQTLGNFYKLLLLLLPSTNTTNTLLTEYASIHYITLHIAKECRQPRRERTEGPVTNDSSIRSYVEVSMTQQNFNTNRVGGMFETCTEEQEVDLLAKIDGKEHQCWFDSGCELIILPDEFVKNLCLHTGE